MSSWTGQQSLLNVSVVIDGARILLVGNSGATWSHFAAAKHIKVCRTYDGRALNTEFRIRLMTRMASNHGLSMQIIHNEFQEGFAVVTRIGAHCLDGQTEAGGKRLKQGNRKWSIFAIGWFCSLPKRQFALGVNYDVIAIAPEENDLS